MAEERFADRREVHSTEVPEETSSAPAPSGVDPNEIDAALERAGCFGRHRLLVAAVSIVASVAHSLSIVCSSLVLPVVECDLDMSSVQLGLVNGAVFAGMLVGSLLFGAVSDAELIRRRGVITATLSIGAFGTLLSAAAPNFFSLMLLCSLIGVGAGGSFPVVLSYFADWQPRRTRGSAVSIFCSCWMLGAMLASSCAWAVLPRPLEWHLFRIGGISFGAWRLYMILCSMPYATAAVSFGFCLPESPKCLLKWHDSEQTKALMNKTAENGLTLGAKLSDATPSQSDSSSSRKLRLLKLITELLNSKNRRSFLLIAALHLVISFSYYGLLLWFPMLFKRAHQLGGGEAGDETSMTSVCAMPAMPANQSRLFINDSATVWSACEPAILMATRPYMETLLVNVASLPGNLILLVLINRVRRKVLLSVSLTLMAASVGLIATVWSHAQALAFSCAFTCMSTIVWSSFNVLAVDLLPSKLQASALGFSFALGRLSSLLGSVAFGALVDAGCLVPMSLSAGALVVGALLASALPA